MDIIALIPSFGGLLFTIASFVVALLIIVAVHELGHYLVGRWSGIYAEVFSLGMGPVLWSRVDGRGTRWQLAAFPVGGYVRFAGDSSAASGRDDGEMASLTPEQRRHTMHGAPLWARAATVIAGPAFNFILSIAVFAVMIGLRGVASDPLTIAELRPGPWETGLEAGDVILSIDGVKTPPLEEFEGFISGLPARDGLSYEVQRGDQRTTVLGPNPFPPLVTALQPDSAAYYAGLQEGDVIQSIEGTPIAAFSELRSRVGESGGKPLALQVWRGGTTSDLVLTPLRADLPNADGGFETRWLIGVTGGMLFEPKTQSPGVIGALGYGAKQVGFIVRSSVSGLYHVVAGQISTCNLRGPIGIAQTSGQVASQGLSNFIWFIAVLSTAVGFLNLFPIPILDGGHLVFHAFEAVAGRPPSDGAMRILMAVGLTLIVALMIFALTNDLTCP